MPWPTEAAACCAGSALGRFFSPSGASPAAIAPEETSTTSAPRALSPASTSTRSRTRPGSMPPAAVVREEDPTLTTIRFAPVTSVRVVMRGPRGSVARRSAAGEGHGFVGCSSAGVVLGPVGVLGAADLVRLGAVGLGLVETAGHVGAGLALAALGQRLLDRPAAVGSRTVVVEALVLAAAAEDLDARVDAGLEVEDHRVVGVADEHGVALLRSQLEQAGLDAEPVQPIGEEADGLVVAEVGLPDPALGLLAPHPPAVLGGGDRELLLAVSRRRTEHDPGRLDRGLRGPRRLDDGGHREGQLAHPLAGRGRDLEDVEPASAELLDHEAGDVTAVGDVDLVEGDQAGPVLEPAVPAQLPLDDVEVVDRVAARLDAGRVDDVDQGGAALDVAQEVVTEAPAVAGALDQAGDVGDG